MSKPTVLHIYKDFYPPVVGGIEKSLNWMGRTTRDEFDVKFLVANTSARTVQEECDGFKVIKAASLGRAFSAPLCPSFPSLIRKHAADILHFHVPNPTGDVSYLLARPRGRVVVTYHSDIVRQKWAMAVYGPLLRRFLGRADVIMPTSPNYIESSPVLRRVREKCEVVPLGIPTEDYVLTPGGEEAVEEIKSIHEGRRLILFVGRLRYYKGLHFLVEAMPRIEATLLIIGEGPERRRLEYLARQFKVTERVKFLGELSDSKVAAHYHAADVFCLPSFLRAEAYGLSQIEAMTCGKPVVSTALDTGVPFVNQHEVTGLVVEPASPRALVGGLNRLLNDESLRKQFGAAARARVLSEFDIAKMGERLKAVYRKVLR
ncbi:MAG: glycosyltransferase [bacterium]